MLAKLKRWFFRFIDKVSCYFGQYDLCEICHVQRTDNTCIGCDRRICQECTTGYYIDEDLCAICRASITPEEEAEDQREQAAFEAEE